MLLTSLTSFTIGSDIEAVFYLVTSYLFELFDFLLLLLWSMSIMHKTFTRNLGQSFSLKCYEKIDQE